MKMLLRQFVYKVKHSGCTQMFI